MIKLSEICDLQNGYAFKSTDYVESSNTINCRMSNIRPGGVFDSTYAIKFLPDDFAQEYSPYLLKDDDLIIAMTDLANDPKIIGIPAIVETNGYNVLLNQRVGKLIIKDPKKIHYRYLCYSLRLPYLRNYYKKFAGGGLQINIGKQDILNISIPFVNLDIQVEIANILDQAQRLIDKRKKQIALLDELIQSVFYDMFGDPVINDRAWNLEKLKNLGALKRGKSSHRPRNAPELLNGPYPLIQTGDIANAGLYLNDYTTTYSELGLKQSKLWSKGTLCITIAANIAKTTIITFDACFPDSVVAFLNKENIVNKMYIQIWMSFLQKIIEDGAPESAQKNINLKILGELDVILPPIELQNHFAEMVENIEKQKELLNKSLAELETNFNSLMQRAFRGELVVE